MVFSLSEKTLSSDLFQKSIDAEIIDFSFSFETTSTDFGELGIITNHHCNLFSIVLKKLLNKKRNGSRVTGNLFFDLTNILGQFDLGFVALVALFKENFEDVAIRIKIPNNDPKNDSVKNAHFKIKTVLGSIQYWYGSYTDVPIFDIICDKDSYSFNEAIEILPLLLIDESNYEKLFISQSHNLNFKKIKSEAGEIEFQKQFEIEKRTAIKLASDKNGEYRSVKNALRNCWNSKNIHAVDRILYLNYLRVLFNENVLSDILADRRPLKSDLLAKYVKQLNNYPPFMGLLFFILYLKTDKNKKDEVQIENLFELSKQIFLGIKQLAKNIIEHTEERKGIMCLRIYEEKEIIVIKGEQKSNLDRYFDSVLSEIKKSANTNKIKSRKIPTPQYLDINIYDTGRVGIVEKLSDNILNLKKQFAKSNNRKLLKFFNDDLSLLRSGTLKFSDFFTNKIIDLKHQSVRLVQHIGLPILTNAILENFGFVIVNSKGKNSDIIDNCCVYKEAGKLISNSDSNISYQAGTYYNLVLPTHKQIKRPFTFISNTKYLEKENAITDITELFDYSVVRNVTDRKSKEDNILLLIDINNPNLNHVSSRLEYYTQAELAAKRIKEAYSFANKGKAFIPVLDFRNWLFKDESDLIRFLAAFQMYVQLKDLIITNLPIETTKLLIDTLMLSEKENFWGELGDSILVYSYYSRDDRCRIYFTDIITGQDRYEFQKVNTSALSNHFTIQRKDIEIFNLDDKRKFPKQNAAFRSCLFTKDGKQVQNFEMILQHNNISLFEHSAQFLLSKPVTNS